jgi:hypothetical protein
MHALVAARRLRRGARGWRCAPAAPRRCGLRATTGERGAVKQDESTVHIDMVQFHMVPVNGFIIYINLDRVHVGIYMQDMPPKLDASSILHSCSQ